MSINVPVLPIGAGVLSRAVAALVAVAARWAKAVAKARRRCLLSLSQVISAFSCELNWSAHRHIQTKISNKLSPETTEKLDYVYSNSKMAGTVSNADELKMFAWDNEDVQPVSLSQHSSGFVPCLAWPGQVDTL